MSEVSEIEKAEKIQEKIVKKKKAYTEKAKEKGDSKNIEKAQAEEDKAVAVLEKIRENKQRAEAELKEEKIILRIQERIRNYVQSKRAAKITEIAKAINIAPETIEKHIEALGMVKDANGKVYSDRNSMSAIRLEEWKKKREVVIKKWSEIAEKNPGLTQEELKEIYIRHYPDDEDIGRYLKERAEGTKTKVISPPTAKIIRYEKKFNGSTCVLCILLCIGIIPGLLYYLFARETIPIYEGDEE